MTEKDTLGVFDAPDIDSLFDSVQETPEIKEKSTGIDLFSDEDETPPLPEKEEEDDSDDDKKDTEKVDLFNEDDVEDKENSSKASISSPGEAIQLLIKSDDNFLVYDGDEAGKVDYTNEQFVDLYQQNIKVQGEQLAESILEDAIQKLSPTMQRVLTGEFKGVNIGDLVKDLSDFQELEKLPENPTAEEKEKIVKMYYNRLAKSTNKDADWVAKKLEKTIDRDELDTEFEDAKELIAQDLEKKQVEKEKEIEVKKKEKEDFKKYHSYFVNESLKEDNLFGISLSNTKKAQIANVLSTFAIRPSDQKEKLGLTALIDSYIHSENPKETYKILGLMALAAVAPNELVDQLKVSAEKKVANSTMRQLKVADKTTAIDIKKKSTIRKT